MASLLHGILVASHEQPQPREESSPSPRLVRIDGILVPHSPQELAEVLDASIVVCRHGTAAARVLPVW